MSSYSHGNDDVDGGKFFTVSKLQLLNHEKFLLKELVLTSRSPDTIQFPLSEFPRVNVNVPDYVGGELKTLNESSIAYKMTKTDELGERKIQSNGHLLSCRKYLFDVFSLKKYTDGTLFVLVQDLMDALLVDGDQDEFLSKYHQFYPIVPDASQLKFIEKSVPNLLKKNEKLNWSPKFVTAKSAFVQFGAAVICEGTRLTDDYWETVARDSSLTSHHRVFKISSKLQKLFFKLQPSFLVEQENQKKEQEHMKNTQANSQYNLDNLELPSLLIMEQPSSEIKNKYLKDFSVGNSTTVSVPGQNISGSLELSTQYKIPKYHNRFSFVQAIQNNAMDIPIDQELNLEGSATESETNTNSQSRPMTPSQGNQDAAHSKPVSRMLSSLLNSTSSSGNKSRKKTSESTPYFKDSRLIEPDLIINGWKFESLPLINENNTDKSLQPYSFRGLPYFHKDKLIGRLKNLTPNNIRELEHMHDSIAANTGIQTARRVRKSRWFKYWQYKAGVPIGLYENQQDYFKNVYLNEILKQVTVETHYDEHSHSDKTVTTIRIPNANFLTNNNIQGVEPPYSSFFEKAEYRK
ncbi:hypothetical protein TPHA_0D00110 [Tetrapisispora phaffii CBS 4417]|uniref:Uncharacterized protein n=1 Tax=Tetrapisispora phaffii (strain ATCC 24235 / CBS 4417 / NBRC 1672 / NRRL Y-8282 / UCD 70-5) TaxID=1071381 RepID=G8BS34_TETPH|nr:hypothetical protein TPHA_0D00110 [Tetrapisispora phaffii CBS 4417]CCE62655.1 hypothetical protein TPHA_0D00110 [Tetrapisispora phaffii CBS 4417]